MSELLISFCLPVKVTEEAKEDGGKILDNDILDARIVAQAITELQEVQGPVVHIQVSMNLEVCVCVM